MVYMSLDEFRTSGLLQEANRQFFHRLGMALAIVTFRDGSQELRLMDSREENPGGLLFEDITPDHAKRAENISREMERIGEIRQQLYRFGIQPLQKGGPQPTSSKPVIESVSTE